MHGTECVAGGALMLSLGRMAAVRRECAAATRIPYRAHVAPTVIRTEAGDYIQALRLGGASFECADDTQINGWHERLNSLWRNIASSKVALWTHVIRRRDYAPMPAGREAGFVKTLSQQYRARLARETLMVNELYLAIVYRPVSGVVGGIANGLLAQTCSRFARREPGLEIADALEQCSKLAQTVQAALSAYDPEVLGCYRVGGIYSSSLLEYLGLLLNGEWQRMPLPRGPINEVLATTRPFFGNEAIEYRTPTQTRVGAMLAIKEYASPSVVGMYNQLLAAPFPLLLTQSFTFLTKAAGQALLQRQYHRMSNAGDFAVSQAEQLKVALDALTSNEFVMGDHHLSLQVLADTREDSIDNCTERRLGTLNDNIAIARSLLADTGMTVAREDLALEAAYWAQLPGHFAMRPRKAPISSRNFSAMAPFHNFPTGRASGNHWGEALTLLVTSARSPYYFSLHASDPKEADGGTRKDTGHTFICGPTGSGKTVFIGFMVAMLDRQGATQVIIDKDHGLEILVRALGGEYLPLKNGLPTGFNPLQLPVEPQHVEFLKVWLRTLALSAAKTPLTVRQQADLDQALSATLALEAAARRLSRLIEFLDPTDPEGVHARLAPWCRATGGDYAWAFDNIEDSVVPRMTGRTVIGFDVTEFLNHGLVRAPVTLYLFHLVRQLLDGRRLVCWMDEFWRLLADPAFESFAKDGPKTWRKLNGVMCLATQSPSDVLDSGISRTIVEQTPTKVFFPNAHAVADEYIKGFGLTEREFRLIRDEIQPCSRMFLVKQGHHSVVCQLDLQGLDAELAVISGRANQLARMQKIIAVEGNEASRWLPKFLSLNLPN